MDFYDATTLMRLVQAVENDPYVSSGAGEALADKVREFIEDEAEMGGWYTELMNAIGEGEITDPLADFTVGRFRVHLVQEGERYGRAVASCTARPCRTTASSTATVSLCAPLRRTRAT